ncbi:AraC family transcriptional regulator [Flavobacterium capsici]|uniref:AraC family transcriptional regulator n=1 Tax=Flavobacterium capsici TaxID=3075618 RepID=A0AA96F4H6_9FLAO|nr:MULTISPECIES: AraC family transcriptional regulator [unclassified Flavobacterium]WNM18489.1 AraC family transcriptional regulator [Flavobacterium sp. PMR2A8]WNM22540.1 AraC family transcriptional regulator [Flavobacterium sp. PMTSA4]
MISIAPLAGLPWRKKKSFSSIKRLIEAKKHKNSQQQASAYKAIMHLVEKKFRMIYADSLLIKAKESKNDITLGSAYLTVGAAFYDNKEYTKALDNYIIANSYISKTEDQYLIHKVKYTIAQTKYYLGYFDEAIAIFTDCINFFKEENETGYLKSLHGIGLCYNQVGRYDLSSFNNLLGIRASKELENEEMIPYFINSEGINQYKLKKYQKAIKLLEETVPEIEKRNDYVSQTITWFYLGKCFWEQNEKDKAVSYFLKTDQLITDKNFIRPDLRENYELLIEYYSSNNDLVKQLKYINKLLAADKILNNNYKYLSYKIHKEFDTKSLIQAKQDIENKMVFNKRIYTITIVFFSTSIVGVTIWHFRTKRRYKQRFNEMMKNKPAEVFQEPVHANKSKTNINPELVKEILQNLKKFEDKKKYLEKDISLVKMASMLNTNTKYVSVIISEYRGKKLTNYINDLKIDHIVELLKNHNKYRNYTNKALAEEVGLAQPKFLPKHSSAGINSPLPISSTN